MAKTKVKLNWAGGRELMRSPEIQGVLQEVAGNVVAKCGDGYEVETYTAQTRAVTGVRAVSPKAIRDCFENNTLIKALHK